MKKIELEELFKQYLLRLPSESEYQIHLNKDYKKFKDELLKCDEYLKITNQPLLDKRIALLISGHIRNHQLISSLSKLSGYDYDVFVHTWDNYGIKGQETNLKDGVDIDGIEKIINQIPNLKSYKIENNETYISTLTDEVTYFNYSSPEKFIKSQLYSINQSFKLFDKYKTDNEIKYDLVIKLRFDLSIQEFLVDRHLINDVQNYKIIFAPNDGCGHTHPDSNSTTCLVCNDMYYKHNLKYVHNFEHSHVMCDLFSYGSYESMREYMSIYEIYDDINQSFVDDNLKKLKKYNIKYEKQNNVYLLQRNQVGHLDSLFYINCSYPERVLQKVLKDYLIPASKKIKVKFLR